VPVLLTIADLEVKAGERLLLAGLALELAAGEIVALRGPSGAGKTTLLRTVAGLQDAAGGAVHLRGADPQAVGWTAWRRQVCLVPQQPAVFPGTVGENLARPFGYRTATARFPADRARTLCDRLRLDGVPFDQPAAQLSVGQQQRLNLVRGLLLDPAVLLLDEPTSALDPDAAAAVEDLVREEVNRREAAALAVSHDPVRAARWADRTLDLSPWLQRGAA